LSGLFVWPRLLIHTQLCADVAQLTLILYNTLQGCMNMQEGTTERTALQCCAHSKAPFWPLHWVLLHSRSCRQSFNEALTQMQRR